MGQVTSALGITSAEKETKTPPSQSPDEVARVLVLFGSHGGSSERYAKDLCDWWPTAGFPPIQRASCDTVDPEDLSKERVVIFIVSTRDGGAPPPLAKFMFSWLKQAPNDPRIGRSFLHSTRFAVLGVGDSTYEEAVFNRAARDLHPLLAQLSATPMLPVGTLDVSVSRERGSAETDFRRWFGRLKAAVNQPQEVAEPPAPPVEDIEDLGVENEKEEKTQGPRQMVNERMRKALTKQGYQLVGSHSAVKLCRWNKGMLRGRGGCYKHTCYGITSHQCLEMTPSLACANKCVFCWRHHTNPVAKAWKWELDAPEVVVEGVIQKQKKLVKVMRGVPGVNPARFEEAFTPKHCALSLVGEPVMYPRINELLVEFHKKGLSTFVVSNGQFPDAIKNLQPSTQVYVSVDASTPDTLKAIDRPLFSDFWERFEASLRALAARKERTVMRLTLVKGFNMEHLADYARLVLLAHPTFVEIKGMTFSGDSKTSSLTMKNVPYHHEVVQFSQKLAEYLGEEYEVSCEHEHSCLVLITHKSLFINGRWHTWIDFPRFHALEQRYRETGEAFTARDYAAPTPEWAVFGAPERGFDPADKRWRRKQKTAEKKAEE